MSALRSDSRQPARYNMMPRTGQATRPALRSVPFTLPQQRPAMDDEDEMVPWLTVYADEDEPGSDEELLLEMPDLSRLPMRPGSASA